MAPLRFDRSRIEALLRLAGEQLDGEWLLIGGGAAAAWFAPARTTEDVDLIGLGGTQAERFALMDFAIGAGVPLEAVNSAADYFVRRIVGWREQLVVLVRGTRATIYRPNATLFALLKLGRLSATDLDDCLHLLAHCRDRNAASTASAASAASGGNRGNRGNEDIDRDRVREALAILPPSADAALTERRRRLDAKLTEL